MPPSLMIKKLWSAVKPYCTWKMLPIALSIWVLTTAFVSDATYPDYPYRATITCSGITTNYSALVNLSATEVLGGTFAPFTDTGSGVVYIYSTEVPSATISVNIIATKVV